MARRRRKRMLDVESKYWRLGTRSDRRPASRSAIATLVDRTSRYVKLVHLPAGHSAHGVREALAASLTAVPAALRLTLTWDQGPELAHHDQLVDMFTDGIYFALPASRWQRGANENTNGLLRQYLQRGSNLSVHTAADLQAIEDRLIRR